MSWDNYFVDLLSGIASRSKDANTKVGCILVGPDNEIRATGYNSLPRGVDDSRPERLERPGKYKWFCHAEQNAVFAAARVGVPLKGCRAYVSLIPCMSCGIAVVQAGITEVIYDAFLQEKYNSEKYLPEQDLVRTLFTEAGVSLRGI